MTVKDHTLIVNAIMNNTLGPAGIKMQLKRTMPEGKEPSAVDVLNAALQVSSIDEHVKSRIRVVLAALPELEPARDKMPGATKNVIMEIQREIVKCENVDEMIQLLKRIKEDKTYDKYEGLSTRIGGAIDLLEDGKDAIYAPKQWCMKCGKTNRALSKFCIGCGKPLS